MSNALVTADEFDTIQRVAKAMVASGYFQDARDVAQAAIKIMAGAEMGLPPFAAMTNIHIIQGRPALGANLIATLIKNDPRYDYRVEQMDDATCSIAFYEGAQKVGVSTFTAADAKKAGTKNMERFPRNMLFARAISNGARWYTPGIFGGAPVYTPEELGAQVDEEGYIIPGEIVAPAAEREELPQLPAGNGKPAESKVADARAWLEGIQHKNLGDVVKAAGMTGAYQGIPDSAFIALGNHPLLKNNGITPGAKKSVTVATAITLFDWLVAESRPVDNAGPEWPEAELDATMGANSPAAQ